MSPIDAYLFRTAGILVLGTPEAIDENASLARLILLGVVSEVESFFKQVLGRCVRLCDQCRLNASKHMIPFAAVDYYDNDIEYALVESVSFSTRGEIISITRKLTGLDLANQELKTVIAQFDQVCHLRHAAVHASGVLGAGNVREITKSWTTKLQLNLKFRDLQTIVATCHNLVREYNRILFQQIIERWISEKSLTGKWKFDRIRFTPAFKVFHSVEDSVGANSAYNAYRNLRPTVLLRLAKVK